MESNLLLEQYSRYKKISLEDSPFKCLLNTNIELNPHQINAFCAAIQALKTGGIIMADEVGLGKTIEAGLVMKYVLDAGAKNILITMPATLRKQWEIELNDKFGIKATILDRLTVEHDKYHWKEWFKKDSQVKIIITSYDYSSKLMKRFPFVKWDLLIIDEAHNLRNVFHGTKRAKNLYDVSEGIPKIMLTATPLQNSLSDLHGLVSFIDPKIFGAEKIFNKKYIDVQNYSDLKDDLSPVLYRTLRKDVVKYMDFKKRTCITVDFQLTDDEILLYNQVNDFLKRDELYSIPVSNKNLIILVIRKLLASSSFALIETFEILKDRLDKLYQGSKSADAQQGFDMLYQFFEDEIDETDFEEKDDIETVIKKQKIQEEINLVKSIIATAEKIKTNAKFEALKTAIDIALEQQAIDRIPQKVVVFTESKRTQKYIAQELRRNGFSEEDVLLFNGDFDDTMSKEIYRAWQVKNYGNPDHGRTVEFKHAIVDYFERNSKILLVTDAGSEGLNLQFCNTIINYDLPWNPQKIEQRIGRCHRYGQKHDVVAMNLLNTGNEADKRVYEILTKKFELFEGVFGASDVALGALESGLGFEKTILNIYQKCNSEQEFSREFDKLNRNLDTSVSSHISSLRNILLTESSESKGVSLENTKKAIDEYLADIEYWMDFPEPEMDGNTYYWRIDNWGEANLGSHGLLFLGAFCDNTKVIFPVLLLCDENGTYIDFTEKEIISALEKADDDNIHYFSPDNDEQEKINDIYQKLLEEMVTRHKKTTDPIKRYNKKKIENWVRIQKEQLSFQLIEKNSELEQLFFQESWARDTLEKADIRKKILKKKGEVEKLKDSMPKLFAKYENDAQKSIIEFDEKMDINPILIINIVLKF